MSKIWALLSNPDEELVWKPLGIPLDIYNATLGLDRLVLADGYHDMPGYHVIATHRTQPLGPNQTKWIEALESGQYAQCTGQLGQKDEGFCCLGVASVLFSYTRWDADGALMASSIPFDGDVPRRAVQRHWCPVTAADALALYSSEGTTRDDVGVSLAKINDNGTRFLELAKLLREDPSRFFKEPR